MLATAVGGALAVPLIAAAATSDNPILSWVSYGAVGVVAIAFFMGWIVPGASLGRIEKQMDKLLDDLATEREKNSALQDGVISTAIPAIAKDAALIESLMPLMQRIIFALDHQGPS